MELIALGGIDKECILANVDEERKRKHQEDEVCKIDFFDPIGGEIVDDTILRRIQTLNQKIKKEETEVNKFKNAIIFTDIPATIKKMGMNSDGTPKGAIGMLFSDKVELKKSENGEISYQSDDLTVVLGSITRKGDRKDIIRFCVLSIFCLINMAIHFWSVIKLSLTPNEFQILSILNLSVPFLAFLVGLGSLSYRRQFLQYIDIGLGMPQIITVDISTKVPKPPKIVLSKIYGRGPFAILFEVNAGWKKVETDPIIFRIISIDGKQFFEPLVGYNMTPLEKKSLVDTQQEQSV